MRTPIGPYHMLPARHHPLVDHLGCVVSTRVDMYALLYDGVRSGAQCLSGLVPTWLYLWRRRRCTMTILVRILGHWPLPGRVQSRVTECRCTKPFEL